MAVTASHTVNVPDSSATTTEVISLKGFKRGSMIWSYDPGAVKAQGGATDDATLRDIYDSANPSVLSQTDPGGANRCVQIPEAWFSALYIKLVGTTNASGAQTVVIMLHSD